VHITALRFWFGEWTLTPACRDSDHRDASMAAPRISDPREARSHYLPPTKAFRPSRRLRGDGIKEGPPRREMLQDVMPA